MLESRESLTLGANMKTFIKCLSLLFEEKCKDDVNNPGWIIAQKQKYQPEDNPNPIIVQL